MKKNWKTTIAGIGVGILHILGHAKTPLHIAAGVAIMALGIVAQDGF